MTLTIVDPNPAVYSAVQEQCTNISGISGICARFEDALPFDCFITAGNSFGIMDGGVDLAVARRFPSVRASVQDVIRRQHRGELLVGNCVIVQTGDSSCEWIAYAPTMRVPRTIVGSDAVYRAMFAALREIRSHLINLEKFESAEIKVGVPALGALTGRMPAAESVRQIVAALSNFSNPPSQNSDMDWDYAHRRHRIAEGIRP